jgi:PTS system mannose-specific IIA component
VVGTLILTHGRLADELLAAAEVIAGDLESFEALCLDWGDNQDTAREKVLAAVARLDDEEGVIILTDMYGGTPFNVAKELTEPGRIELVCGVNLPMVLRLGCRTGGGCEQMKVADLAAWLEGKGRQSVRRVAAPRGAPKAVGK